ncbi:MAG: AAA family ATPase [Lachnospiraceae bacterium]|nr:AAA family ATPase [Lachnospiraceae bacterium]
MNYTYYLPNKEGIREEHTTDSNSIFIIGANGSGKSRLGVWMETQNAGMFYRITGQRSLTFNDTITLRTADEADNYLFFGHSNEKNRIYKYGGMDNFATTLIQDFNEALSDLLAKYRVELDCFFKKCKDCEKNGKKMPSCPDTIIDKLIRVWNYVFPHRKLKFERDKFIAEYEGKEYPASKMSDGERAVLYLSAITLCSPFEKLIIDEPELHLHPSIMHNLWRALEIEKADILFIYITHDMDFVMSHFQSLKVWVKSYDGANNWDYKKIENNELPEELLLDILGTRKDVLLVEGESNSIDYSLYSCLFPNYFIIPSGSCSNVINKTIAMNDMKEKMGFNYNIYGLIDRDYRNENEIKKYKSKHIYALNVAEVENLLIVPEVLEYMANKISLSDSIANARDYIIETKFKNEMHKQINEKFVAEIKYQLSIIDINLDTDDEIKDKIMNLCSSESFDDIKNSISKEYNDALLSKDLKKILKIFNCKGLYKSVGEKIGYKMESYYTSFINSLNSKNCGKLVDAINTYLPMELQITKGNI